MSFLWSAKKPPVARVLISPLLTEELVHVCEPGLGKEELIGLLVGRLCSVRGLGDPNPYLESVLERERGMSTTLDSGLSVPHARIDGLSSVCAALGLAPCAIADLKSSNLPIQAMFVFFSPNRQDQVVQHLQVLRAASSLFTPQFIGELLRDPSADSVLRRIAEREESG